MKIALGSDHGGFKVKQKLIDYLSANNNVQEIMDVGTHCESSSNYAQYGIDVAEMVSANEVDLGIVICSTGEGICIAANKVKGVRCGIIYDDESARLTKEHNNCNVIAFGAKTMDISDIIHRLKIFMDSKFEGGRHQTRLDYIRLYEENN